MFVRILIAVVVCVLIFALIPQISALFGLGIHGPLLNIIRICALGAAFFWVIGGSDPSSWWPWRRPRA